MSQHEHVFVAIFKAPGLYRCECKAVGRRNIMTGQIELRVKRVRKFEEPTINVRHREYFDQETFDDDRAIGSTFYDTEPERAHAKRVNEKFAIRMIWEL